MWSSAVGMTRWWQDLNKTWTELEQSQQLDPIKYSRWRVIILCALDDVSYLLYAGTQFRNARLQASSLTVINSIDGQSNIYLASQVQCSPANHRYSKSTYSDLQTFLRFHGIGIHTYDKYLYIFFQWTFRSQKSTLTIIPISFNGNRHKMAATLSPLFFFSVPVRPPPKHMVFVIARYWILTHPNPNSCLAPTAIIDNTSSYNMNMPWITPPPPPTGSHIYRRPYGSFMPIARI